MSRIVPIVSHTPTEASRYHALRAQTAYLRDPSRTDGPSRWEAEESALSIDEEADALSESLYWSGAERVAREFSLLCPDLIPASL